MQKRTISITHFDLERLEELLDVADEFSYRDRSDLENLAEELRRGKLVDSRDVPPNVVTMNSRVRMHDLDSGEEMEYTLVFPKNADVEAGKISVISPLGTAILGYAVGDTVEYEVPAGKRRIRIAAVPYQPEAAGDFHL